MKRVGAAAGLCLAALSVTTLALAGDKKPKAGPLTGTWECWAHGTEYTSLTQGDVPFTLHLEQSQQAISGSVDWLVDGGNYVVSGTLNNNAVEIHFKTLNGTYTLTGKLEKNQLNGDWSTNPKHKGAWEGGKHHWSVSASDILKVLAEAMASFGR